MTRVHGKGFNRMYRLDTDLGSFAVKELNLDRDWTFRHDDVFRFEQAAFGAGIAMPEPILASQDMLVHGWVDGEVVPWMARPPHLEALADTLRFSKLPLSWQWRPAVWPVWNHTIVHAACFWNSDDGRAQHVLDGLATDRLDELVVEAPAMSSELAAQLSLERDVARDNLARVTASYHDQTWRREHRGGGIYPDEHLWSATAAFLELDDALERLAR